MDEEAAPVGSPSDHAGLLWVGRRMGFGWRVVVAPSAATAAATAACELVGGREASIGRGGE